MLHRFVETNPRHPIHGARDPIDTPPAKTPGAS